MELPVVSVIVANFNCAKYIGAAIRSALNQTLANIEIIVADDGSTDDSVDIVAAIAAEDDRLILLPSIAGQQGPSAARNRCIAVARGTWVAVLDSDDLMDASRLSNLVAHAERDKADIVADDLFIFDDDGKMNPTRCLSGITTPFWLDAPNYASSNAFDGNHLALGYLKPMIKTEMLRRVQYNTDLRLAEDFDLIMRLLISGAVMRVYPEATYRYRKHSSSISYRLSQAKLLPVIRASEKLLSENKSNQPLYSALNERHATIKRALAFETLILTLKKHDWMGAMKLAIRNPRAAIMLHQPVTARLTKLKNVLSKINGISFFRMSSGTINYHHN